MNIASLLTRGSREFRTIQRGSITIEHFLMKPATLTMEASRVEFFTAGTVSGFVAILGDFSLALRYV